MKRILTILIFNLLFAGFLLAQPVSLGTLRGTETYFTGFADKVYFACGSEILIGDTISKSIRTLTDLGEPVVSDARYSITFSRYSRPGTAFFVPVFPTAGDYIYFMTKPEQDSVTLWRSHRDESSTEAICAFDTIQAWVAFNNTLFFYAGKSGYGRQIWRVNANGTVSPISDRPNPAEDNYPWFTYRGIVAGDAYLYYTYQNPVTAKYELYQSDGTPEGTGLITDTLRNMYSLTYLDGKLFYLSDRWLWRYDHTTNTRIVGEGEGYYPGYVEKVNNYLIYGMTHEMDPGTNFYSMENGTGAAVSLGIYGANSVFIPVGSRLAYYNQYDRYPNEFYRTDGTPEGSAEFMRYSDNAVADRFLGVKGYLFYSRERSNGEKYYLNYDLTQSDLNGPGVSVSALFGGVREYTMANNFTKSDHILFFTTADSSISTVSAPNELLYYVPVDPVITATSRLQTMEWSVYPNPASDHCVIKADASGTLQLMNAAGRVVLEVAFDRMNVLDMSGLQSGIYFARLITGDKVSSVQKIVRK